MNWKLAARAEKMNPSVLREILKVTERPGIISLAGGLPSPKAFPINAFAEACAEVLHKDGQAALQYGASEGYGPLREAVAAMLPWPVDPAWTWSPRCCWTLAATCWSRPRPTSARCRPSRRWSRSRSASPATAKA